jgi:transcriptional regulator with XRE-family HTH domain
MKLKDVLRIERERNNLTVEQMAAKLGLKVEFYEELEGEASPLEGCGYQSLAQIAIKLSTPTSRLISKTGKSSEAKQYAGQCGKLITTHREKRRISRGDLAKQLNIPIDELAFIEEGKSQLEVYAPLLLQFAELVGQPIFNLFYPCGLPLDRLEDYPLSIKTI